MTSQSGKLTIWPQTIKFGQIIENKKINIFLQKSIRKWGRETSSRPLFVFKRALYEEKASSLQLSIHLNGPQFGVL